eukprot:TRINITY_DN4224_c0_g1_i2.p2 TRINITY_DN4224_c0_g1~~TRINITY_DN4224_c0_g1_i2.p2  ORF type:complete len:239 (+),score=72.44 TRINITY_DN4224_c0_g1_i2:63-719(+)
MPLLTLISRVSDTLMLAESMDSTVGEKPDELEVLRSQAKQVLKKLGAQSPTRLTIEAGPHYFVYLVQNNVCFLTLCEKSYPKKLAFSFLEELQKEFDTSYGAEVEKIQRPYGFIMFDSFIQKTKKLYLDTRSQRNISKVAEDLRDVQKIMTKNLQDILERGDKIQAVAARSEELVSQTSKYHSNAKSFHNMMVLRQYAPFVIAAIIIILVIILRLWFW